MVCVLRWPGHNTLHLLQASDVTDLLKKDELRECGLKLLAECVHKCPETVLSELIQQWTDSITGVLNVRTRNS